jgi:uncharacterized protein YutE (UPF0331/DUF86 family)
MAKQPPDLDKLRDKIQFIRAQVESLEAARRGGREAFLQDSTLETAAIRRIQIAVEAMLDAANHIVAREGLGVPRTYRESMRLLVDADILPRDRAGVFEKMVGFRNRAVHLYDEINPEEVWTIIDTELDDFEAFVRAIVVRYFDSPADDQSRANGGREGPTKAETP